MQMDNTELFKKMRLWFNIGKRITDIQEGKLLPTEPNELERLMKTEKRLTDELTSI